MLTDLEGRGRIMVVDDDPDVSAMLRTYFTMQGYEVDVVSHGADVLPRCHRHRPDLVLLDIMLPDVNGYEVCRELRSDLYTNRIPIIFLTQKHNRTDRLAGLALGSDDYVTKPFNGAVSAVVTPQQLGSNVRRHRGIRTLYRDLSPSAERVHRLRGQNPARGR